VVTSIPRVPTAEGLEFKYWVDLIWYSIATRCGCNRFRYSFICQRTSTRKQREDLFGLRVKLLPVTTNLTTQK